MLICSLREQLKTSKTKKLTLAFLFLNTSFSLYLIFKPLLITLENNIDSLFWSFITLIPLFILIFIDYISYYSNIDWSKKINDQKDSKIFIALVKTAFFVSLLYFVIFQLRQVDFQLNFNGMLFILAWSIAAHLVLFMAIFLTINLLRAIAKLTVYDTKLEFWLLNILAIVFLAGVFNNIIFSAIAFTGYLSNFFAIIFASVILGFLMIIQIIFLANLSEKEISKTKQIIFLTLLAIITYLLTIKFTTLDWNFLLQKLIAIVIWCLSFICFYLTKAKTRKMFLTICFALVCLTFYKLVVIAEKSITWKNENLTATQLVDKYIGYDISSRILREIFTPKVPDNSFYKFLQESSNLGQAVKINPQEINLVENFANNLEEKPNIFIFTIDSLRQDYIGTYNKSVTFTPEIDTFASESIVLENAFTRYGATGLSEPSIWAGGMLIHKQYVTPFYPMNSLQKLLEKENYQSFISIDSILETIVKPSENIIALDKGVSTQDLNLCVSLNELKAKLVNQTNKKQPIFSYTQPQNLHISVINRENKSVLDKQNYQGFYAPYASRVKKVDTCFGDFIKFLKQEGLFENSIIIFTSDHGDSLGEENRFGHAYTIFPEILRIPLIIHLPERLKNKVVWDSKKIAFSADITPSLYYLLGHKPIINSNIFGRPLFTSTLEEQKAYLKDNYLVASSYGAVYGILSNNGNTLYIADSINFRDYFYDLTLDPRATTNLVNSVTKTENEKLIRRHIEEINNFYQFTPNK
ncbi:MAG: sulfatase-like hydrolase/transferase [Blastocatellia bacterium]|nr:sulfatase-like hydrolase/transferase [Blastocatellia bacterium]